MKSNKPNHHSERNPAESRNLFFNKPQLFCLLLVLIFITLGCEEKITKPAEVIKPAGPTKLTQSLHQAAADGNIEKVKLLISKGADVNAKDNGGYTPLSWAIWDNHRNVITVLITHGADVNFVAKDDWPFLHYAVWNNDRELVEFFLAHGARLDVKDRGGWTALRYAVSQGYCDLVEFLVTKGAEAPEFHLAACIGDLERVKAFLEEETGVDVKDQFGWTPLYWAASTSQEDVAEFLIDKGADIAAKAEDSSTPMHQAAKAGDRKIVELFITKGADVNAKDKNENTPLHNAASAGQRQAVELLIAKGADVNAKNDAGQTPLDIAVGKNSKEIVELLVEKGAIISLHSVVTSGDLDMLRRLIAKGADVNGKDKDGRTPLHHAAEKGLDGLVKELIVNNADVYATDIYGQTPLHCAAYKGHNNVAEFLLAKGAHINARDNAGRAPLHYAVGAGKNRTLEAGHTDVVELLLAKGANVNAKDSWSWTPLHYAVRMANKAMVELLVNRGADLSIADKRGHTASSLAQRCLSLVRYILDSKISDVYRERIADLPSHYSKIIDILSKGGGVYYVATDGKDFNPGTVSSPFRTLGAAIDAAEPGDTIFVRGGVYSCSSTIYIYKSGEEGKQIRLWAFDGETPIFDFSDERGRGFLFIGAYWHLKGLNITNVEMGGIWLDTQNAHHNVIEQVKSHGNGDTGINLARGTTNNLILNCDSYQNFDPETDGENADGFGVKFSIGAGNIFIGCRAWNNSDDGYDFWEAGTAVRAEKCYAWRNGENLWDHPRFTGNANGFKLGMGLGRHVLIGCVAWNHGLGGFNLNGNETGVILYSCTAFKNSPNYRFWQTQGIERNIIRNCLSFKGHIRIKPEVDGKHNSWNEAVSMEITENDFLNLDNSDVTGPRNPDGSIPDSDFLRLAPDSDAIDAGMNVGLPFNGKAPDLGAFEYDSSRTQQQAGVKWLHQAVRDHDIQKIRTLLSEGDSINDKDWLGYAPLHWACYFGYADVAKLLLDSGANPNLLSDTGRTPLEISKAMDYDKIAELLRKHGAKE